MRILNLIDDISKININHKYLILIILTILTLLLGKIIIIIIKKQLIKLKNNKKQYKKYNNTNKFHFSCNNIIFKRLNFQLVLRNLHKNK